MAIYNAWVDRAPILMFAGNGVDAASAGRRRVDALRSGPAAMCAISSSGTTARIAAALCESTVRAYRMMMSPPAGPGVITLDIDLQNPDRGREAHIPSSRLRASAGGRARAARGREDADGASNPSSSPTAACARRKASTRW